MSFSDKTNQEASPGGEQKPACTALTHKLVVRSRAFLQEGQAALSRHLAQTARGFAAKVLLGS